MNYGAEPADQVVRYSLEGTEVALRLSGRAAVTFAKFVAAVLQDQKKTHGKTRLVRLLREGKPLKFFSVEKERMREFAHEAKMHGLLFVPMRDKTDPDHIEIAILADDASKVNRIFDRLQLDVVDTGIAEAVGEVAQDMEAVPTEAPDTPQKDPRKEEEAPVFPFPARHQTEPEPAPPSMPSSNSSEKSPPMWPGFHADQVRGPGVSAPAFGWNWARSAPFWPPARNILPCPDRPSESVVTVWYAGKSFPIVFNWGMAICAGA